MTTAQQLGLVGNSVRVQALPTASAETFGQGNRYYTLIGQQEGYITGHTYHTIVANDVYSWEDVAGGDYNQLDNIPVINQDLTASGFTPTANTYYRHTGATTATFTQGVIYLYDTAYHKLGESGGGTTLNKYTYTIPENSSSSVIGRVYNILKAAKGRVFAQVRVITNWQNGEIIYADSGTGTNNIMIRDVAENYGTEGYYPIIKYYSFMADKNYYTVDKWTYKDNGTTEFSHNKYAYPSGGLKIIYYNDTEIT